MERTVLVTGATSGIGHELAELFAADGYHVVLTARSAEELQIVGHRLESSYSIRASCIPADLSAPSGPQLLLEWLAREGIEIDVLVNNAGFGVYGPFVQNPLDAELAMLDLHVRNLTFLTKQVLPPMVKKGRGGILNVASTAAFQPGPLMAVYYASKSYVLSFSEALAGELYGTGVTVTSLCPGPTATRFTARAGLSAVKLFAGGKMEARAVARMGYTGFKRGKPVVVPGARNRLLAFSVRLVPRRLSLAVVKWLHRMA